MNVIVPGVVQAPGVAAGKVVDVVVVVDELGEDEVALGTVVVELVSGAVAEGLVVGPVVGGCELSVEVVLLDPGCGLTDESSVVVDESSTVVVEVALSVVAAVELASPEACSSTGMLSVSVPADAMSVTRGTTVAGGGAITSLLTTPTPAHAIDTAPMLATTHSAPRAQDLIGPVWLLWTGPTPKGPLKFP